MQSNDRACCIYASGQGGVDGRHLSEWTLEEGGANMAVAEMIEVCLYSSAERGVRASCRHT